MPNFQARKLADAHMKAQAAIGSKAAAALAVAADQYLDIKNVDGSIPAIATAFVAIQRRYYENSQKVAKAFIIEYRRAVLPADLAAIMPVPPAIPFDAGRTVSQARRVTTLFKAAVKKGTDPEKAKAYACERIAGAAARIAMAGGRDYTIENSYLEDAFFADVRENGIESWQ